jgi:hypothetical protein
LFIAILLSWVKKFIKNKNSIVQALPLVKLNYKLILNTNETINVVVARVWRLLDKEIWVWGITSLSFCRVFPKRIIRHRLKPKLLRALAMGYPRSSASSSLQDWVSSQRCVGDYRGYFYI